MDPHQKLKVWFLSGWYPTRVHDTLGNFVQRHAASVALYADVTVIHVCTDEKLNKEPEWVTTRRDGISEWICYVPGNICRGPWAFFKRYLVFRKQYLRMAEAIQQKDGAPDILHANVLYPVTLFARILARKFKVPFVVTEHWTGYLPEDPVGMPIIQRSLSKRMARASSCMLPVTEHLAKAMQDKGLKGRYHVISNVVDTEIFLPSEKIHDGKTHLMHISTLFEPQKNVNGLLEALSILKESHKNFVLQVISDGDFSSYGDRVSELGLNDHVVFLGKLNAVEVAGQLSQCHVLLLSSRYENFPCVIPEALSCGVPVISTNVGGIAEHLQPALGVLVEAFDMKAYASELADFMDHPGRYEEDDLRAYAVAHFSKSVIGRQFMEVYQKVLNNIVS